MKSIINITMLLALLIMASSSCVQETQPKTIHFKLDMRGIQSISKVGIRGGSKPLTWENTLLLTDDNNDSIYEGTINLNSASFGIEFKFVNQYDQFELQSKNNRGIKFEYEPEIILYEAVFNKPNGKASTIK